MFRRLMMLRAADALTLGCGLLLGCGLICGCGQGPILPPTEQAELKLRQGDYAQAIELANQVLNSGPETDGAATSNEARARVYLTRGRAYQCQNAAGDLNRAIEDFSEAIRLAPENSEAYYSRSMAYRDAGNAELAEADDQKAREVDPRVRQEYARLPDTTDAVGIDLDGINETVRAETESARAAAQSKGLSNDFDDYLRLRERYDTAPSTAASDAAPTPRQASTRESTEAAPLVRGQVDRGAARGQNAARAQENDKEPAAKSARTEKGRDARLTSPLQVPAPVNNPFGNGNSGWQQSQSLPGAQARPVQSPFAQPPPKPTGFSDPLQSLRSGVQQPVQSPFTPNQPRLPNIRQIDLDP